MFNIATSLEQSKILKDILPLESADMSYRPYREEGGIPDYKLDICPYRFASWVGYPAWSLNALLNYLKSKSILEIEVADSFRIEADYYDEEECKMVHPIHSIMYESEDSIDACYGMIIKLHEDGLL